MTNKEAGQITKHPVTASVWSRRSLALSSPPNGAQTGYLAEGTGQGTMPGDGTTNGVAVPLRFDTALTGISGVYIFDHVRLGR